MKQRVTKQIGQVTYEFEVEGENLFETTMAAQKLSFDDIDKCDLCGSTDLKMYAYVATGDYKYVKVACNKCGAGVTFGQKKKDPETFYLRKNDDGSLRWEKFEKE